MDGIRVGLYRSWIEAIAARAGIPVPWEDHGSLEEWLSRMHSVWEWVEREAVSVEAAVGAWAATLGVPCRSEIDARECPATFVRRVPISMARRFRVIPVRGERGIEMVVCDVEGYTFGDVVGRMLGEPLCYSVAPPSVIDSAINAGYQQQRGGADQLIESLEDSPEMERLRSLVHRVDLLDVMGRAPVIQLVNMILFDAVQSGASDVHIQPYEDALVVRFRIDGILFDQFTIPKGTQEEMVSRIKVLGRMNIAEKRLPQDGRASVQVGDRQVDLRIASLPTSFGERVVIRLLEKSGRLLTLGELGMPEDRMTQFRRLIHLEHGLILVTGPTGAGKSTTLYAALQEINAKDRNILTIEDPIEYQLEGISQTQVSVKKGLTFASGLRSVLRQDPDIIMVGEIRDEETAEMAIQSALTGHLVFSTLHTNDAASAVTRLLDLGIEPYLVASSLRGVLAQRLVRRICRECRRPTSVDSRAWKQLGATGSEKTKQMAYRGEGCSECRRTGYRGRIGLFELMVCGEEIRGLIQRGADASRIRAAAQEHGMRLLREDGIAKIAAGWTTIEEVLRVAGTDEEER